MWVVLVKERGGLAWLSQLRHPYRLNPESGGSVLSTAAGLNVIILSPLKKTYGIVSGFCVDWDGSGVSLPCSEPLVIDPTMF